MARRQDRRQLALSFNEPLAIPIAQLTPRPTTVAERSDAARTYGLVMDAASAKLAIAEHLGEVEAMAFWNAAVAQARPTSDPPKVLRDLMRDAADRVRHDKPVTYPTKAAVYQRGNKRPQLRTEEAADVESARERFGAAAARFMRSAKPSRLSPLSDLPTGPSQRARAAADKAYFTLPEERTKKAQKPKAPKVRPMKLDKKGRIGRADLARWIMRRARRDGPEAPSLGYHSDAAFRSWVSAPEDAQARGLGISEGQIERALEHYLTMAMADQRDRTFALALQNDATNAADLLSRGRSSDWARQLTAHQDVYFRDYVKAFVHSNRPHQTDAQWKASGEEIAEAWRALLGVLLEQS